MKPLDIYEVTRFDGSTYHKLSCSCFEATEIVEGWLGSFKLTQEFRQWLFAHCSFKIKVHIGYADLSMEFPCVASAMAFKFRWCGR